MPVKRSVNGILLLDKPAGLSSNQALQRARSLFAARKAGHSGSLDPFATGMLPVCFGEATKFSGALLESAKGYLARGRLGIKTSTGDPDGEVAETRPVPTLSRAGVERVLAEFTGEIEQIPPMYSALKHQGRRLYQLAREGREVERPPRRVQIRKLELVALDGSEIELKVACSKGTYIRTLIEDVAAALGTVGHAIALRRTWVGPFAEAAMHPLTALEADAEPAALDRLLLPVDAALASLPALELNRSDAQRVRHGQTVTMAADRPGQVRLYRAEGGFLGLGEIRDDGSLAPMRLIAAE